MVSPAAWFTGPPITVLSPHDLLPRRIRAYNTRSIAEVYAIRGKSQSSDTYGNDEDK